jgi:hypothetical protein
MDYVTYGEKRAQLQSEILKIRKARRIGLGSELTFLFQNTATIRQQIQESVYRNQFVQESHIQGEIDAYNQQLASTGELSCTLRITIPQDSEYNRSLQQWKKRIKSIYLLTVTGEKLRPIIFIPSSDERLSSIYYLRFVLGSRPPTALGIDHSEIQLETSFTREQRQALIQDLNP